MLERWLRRVDRLPTDIRKREKILSACAVELVELDAVLTSPFRLARHCVRGDRRPCPHPACHRACDRVPSRVPLADLAQFDNFNHSSVHWSMAAIFIVLTSLSAILQTGQVWSLHKDHPDRKSLLRNSIIKLIILFFGVAGAISFAALYGVCHGSSLPRKKHSAQTCNRVTSGAAAMEWAIAFILVFFFLTLVADLWPAGKSSPRYMRQLARWQEKHEPGVAHEFTGRRAFAAHPERWENDGDAALDPAEARAEEMHAAMKARNQGVDPTAPSPANFPPPTVPLSSIAIHSNEPLNAHAAEPGQSRV